MEKSNTPLGLLSSCSCKGELTRNRVLEAEVGRVVENRDDISCFLEKYVRATRHRGGEGKVFPLKIEKNSARGRDRVCLNRGSRLNWREVAPRGKNTSSINCTRFAIKSSVGEKFFTRYLDISRRRSRGKCNVKNFHDNGYKRFIQRLDERIRHAIEISQRDQISTLPFFLFFFTYLRTYIYIHF